MRKNISTHSPSEKRVGYSRAVLIDGVLYFSGTTSVDRAGKTVGKTVYEQSVFIFKKIEGVLKSEGYVLGDVIKMTVFLVDMKQLGEFDKAFKEFFYNVKPACTLVGIHSLVAKDLLIEIECTAQKESG